MALLLLGLLPGVRFVLCGLRTGHGGGGVSPCQVGPIVLPTTQGEYKGGGRRLRLH